jgi:hypothetical protein
MERRDATHKRKKRNGTELVVQKMRREPIRQIDLSDPDTFICSTEMKMLLLYLLCVFGAEPPADTGLEQFGPVKNGLRSSVVSIQKKGVGKVDVAVKLEWVEEDGFLFEKALQTAAYLFFDSRGRRLDVTPEDMFFLSGQFIGHHVSSVKLSLSVKPPAGAVYLAVQVVAPEVTTAKVRLPKLE